MSLLLDREVSRHHALVVDGNPTSRSVLAQQLRDFGFASVKQASRVGDARELLEHRKFQLVVCEQHFDHGGETGQELLDELRREQMLPHSTVFVMVTGEATYTQVAEAAEAALDSFLVKPYSAQALFERVKEARQRKRVLKDIFEALEARDLELAAQLCQQRFEQRALYAPFAARIGAELLLELRRPSEARRQYQAALALQPWPWARLGVARSLFADGDLTGARRQLEQICAELPHFADGHDVLARLLVEQGHLAEALQSSRAAAQLTPGCVLRLQQAGTLSFYVGESARAAELLERTWQLGARSRLFDVLSMMLLAFVRLDGQDGKGLSVCQEVMARFAQRHPQSVRLRRMAAMGRALELVHAGHDDLALDAARELLAELPQPDFDMEAATNTLSLWSRLAQRGLDGGEFGSVTQRLAQRFCVSRAATEVLMAAVRLRPDGVDTVRAAHAQVMQLAEQAMNHALAGQPLAAVRSLLHRGGESGNAKLIEMAGAVAQRHRERIDGVDELLSTAATLAHRYAGAATHMAGVRRSNRSAGGLVLRR